MWLWATILTVLLLIACYCFVSQLYPFCSIKAVHFCFASIYMYCICILQPFHFVIRLSQLKSYCHAHAPNLQHSSCAAKVTG